jgi:AbrB family looped-hinge helix DNA binding protein
MTATNVTSKGQITIPAHLRKKYKITENSKVEIIEENEKIIIKKLDTVLDLAGTGNGTPEELKQTLDQMRKTDAKQGNL